MKHLRKLQPRTWLHIVLAVFLLVFGGYLWVQAGSPLTQHAQVANEWGEALCNKDTESLSSLTYGAYDDVLFAEATLLFIESLGRSFPCEVDVQEHSLDKLPISERALDHVDDLASIEVKLVSPDGHSLDTNERTVVVRLVRLSDTGELKVIPPYWRAEDLLGYYDAGESATLSDNNYNVGRIVVEAPMVFYTSKYIYVGIPVTLDTYVDFTYFDTKLIWGNGYVFDRASKYDIPDTVEGLWFDTGQRYYAGDNIAGVIWFDHNYEAQRLDYFTGNPNIVFTVSARTDYWAAADAATYKFEVDLDDDSRLGSQGLPFTIEWIDSNRNDDTFTLEFEVALDLSDREEDGYYFSCDNFQLIMANGRWLKPVDCGGDWGQQFYPGDPLHIRKLRYSDYGDLTGAIIKYREPSSNMPTLWEYPSED